MDKLKNMFVYVASGAIFVGLSVWLAKYSICRDAGYSVIICVGAANR